MNIKELDTYCRLHNKSIATRKGKMIGIFGGIDYAVGPTPKPPIKLTETGVDVNKDEKIERYTDIKKQGDDLIRLLLNTNKDLKS